MAWAFSNFLFFFPNFPPTHPKFSASRNRQFQNSPFFDLIIEMEFVDLTKAKRIGKAISALEHITHEK